ncbi:MAG: TonB-dependent receptor [Muribaculaceae bacterium]|nr:TonB-dependent receptor [Muribaculaceae bacterium]
MRIKLFLMLLLSAMLPAMAQNAVVTGSVIDADTGSPVAGAVITIPDQGISVTTGPNGDFRISNARPGEAVITVTAPGYDGNAAQARLFNGQSIDAGAIRLFSEFADNEFVTDNQQEMLIDESMMEDEDGNSQSVGALTGANDDIYFRFSRFGYSPLYSNYRGYGSTWSDTYINSLPMNDLIRGGFSFQQLGGMTSRAFRNSTSTVGLGASAYGFGAIGGSQNFNTITETYAPGFNGALSFTNSNYKYRAMATYSTGMQANGLALTVSAIGRYADEGVVPGTFYAAGGFFLSAEKMFNRHHSLTLTAWCNPRQYANGKSAVQETFDLTGDNLYNPSWGYQNGKKRSDNIRENFDPTVMLNWLYKTEKTVVNTGAAFRWVNYARTRLSYYKGNDTRPDYYRNLPSYWMNFGNDNVEMYDFYTDLWENDEAFRQIHWDDFYQANYLNNVANETRSESEKIGSTYIQQMEHSNQFNFILGSTVNHRLTDNMTLQGGVNLNYTRTNDYATVRDLLGGQFWLDVDGFAERDFNNPAADPNIVQNDLNNPNRRAVKGDRIGWDYSIFAVKAQAWLQNQINLPKWDINYGLTMSYEQFYRHGYMRNGRAPENSFGRSKTLHFDDASFKAGATYKLNGRNYFTLQAQYGTVAPVINDVYISPRIKDTTVDDLTSTRVLSADFRYTWNYRRFRGSISAYVTDMTNAIERYGFWDESLNAFCNFALSGVHRRYQGIELGMAYQITSSLRATFAGNYSRYRYKNNPWGTRSQENGLNPDVTNQFFLKNYYCTSTPQTAFNIGLAWNAPKMWFFNIDASWLADYYARLAYPRHQVIEGLGDYASSEEELQGLIDAFTAQPKLKNQWVMNASVGKLIYINRKVSLNFNLSVSNLLNNRNLITQATEQFRIDTRTYDPNAYPTKFQYAQGIKVYVNAGVRF